MDESRFNEIWAAVEDHPIRGWYAVEEARVLTDLASRSPGPIVEIGCYLGRSTCLLALAANHLPVITIDPFSWDVKYEEMVANLDRVGVGDRVRVLKRTAEEALYKAPMEIGLLHIDDSHERQNVLAQLRMYGPRVMENGSIVMHDWPNGYWKGVAQAGEAWLKENPDWHIAQIVQAHEGLAVLKRKD